MVEVLMFDGGHYLGKNTLICDLQEAIKSLVEFGYRVAFQTENKAILVSIYDNQHSYEVIKGVKNERH